MGAVTVNVVSADLSHEETILQIADALDTLDKVSLETALTTFESGLMAILQFWTFVIPIFLCHNV